MVAGRGIAEGQFRVVALDIDGTVLKSSGEPPDYFQSLLEYLHGLNVSVVFCTGRRWQSAVAAAGKMPGNPNPAIICSGGALIKHAVTHTTIKTLPLSPETAGRAGMLFRECGIVPYFLRDCRTGERELLVAQSDRGAAEEVFYLSRNRGDVCFFDGETPDVMEPVLMVYSVDRKERVLAAADFIAEKYGGRFRITALNPPSFGPHYWALEVHDINVSKWHALRFLLDGWGLNASRVIAIGDDVNDVTMLRRAGISFAMANGVEEAKQAADYITDSNDEDGVLKALARVFPGIKEIFCYGKASDG